MYYLRVRYYNPTIAETWTAFGRGLVFLDGPLPVGDFIYIVGIGAYIVANGIVYAKSSKKSDKEKANNVSSRAKDQKPKAGESGNYYAKRLMNIVKVIIKKERILNITN